MTQTMVRAAAGGGDSTGITTGRTWRTRCLAATILGLVVIAAGPKVKATDFQGLVEEAKERTVFYATSGSGSSGHLLSEAVSRVTGMAMEPVATAASNNPLLTTLTAALSGGVNPDVNLVDTLNNGEYTVFAPVDDAFAQIDDATMEALQTDADLLTGILTYHVVEGQITPDEISGMQTTLNGADVDVTGSGDELMVNGANVVCGGVETANATVYLIDQVLIPEE